VSVATAITLFKFLFGPESNCLELVPVDKLYAKVLQHTYGDRASEVHPFILEEANPLYVLIRLNVILLGSPIILTNLIWRIGYLQRLRAISAITAFECIGNALRREQLAVATQRRRSALVVQAALLLDQVIEMKEDLPSAAIAYARGEVFHNMREHLMLYLSYYIQKLAPTDYQKRLVSYMRVSKSRGHMSDEFWAVVSEIGLDEALKKPPVLQRYADLGLEPCGGEESLALHDFFASHCSISS
jgi:hypothetical protein